MKNKNRNKTVFTAFIALMAAAVIALAGVTVLLPSGNKNISGGYAASTASETLATGFSVEIMGDSLSALDKNSYNSYRYVTTSRSDMGPVTTLSYPSEDLGFATTDNVGKILQDSEHSTYAARYYKITFNPGTYHISLFGAQGGHAFAMGQNDPAAVGGKGAQTEGVFTFTNRVSMYLFVGGAGMDYASNDSSSLSYYKFGGFNGGGDAFSQDDAAGGGGATDLRYVVDYGDYNYGRNFITKYGTSTASLNSRVMVAAGGGGANSNHAGGSTAASLLGAAGASGTNVNEALVGGGGAFSEGGSYSSESIDVTITTGQGTYGAGGGYSSGSLNNGTYNGMVVPAVMAAGGGGGWYGGGASANNQAAGGAGSSFVAGQSVSANGSSVDCTRDNTGLTSTMVTVVNAITEWETLNGVQIKDAKYVAAANGISTTQSNNTPLRSSNGYAVITSLSSTDSDTISDGIKKVQAQIEYEDEVSMNTALSSDEYAYKTYQDDSLTLNYPGKTAYGDDADYLNKLQASAHWKVTLQPGVYQFSLYGAQGGSNGTNIGGYGGLTQGTLTITKKTTLYFYVGGAGVGGGSTTSNNVIRGGYNGGGDASSSTPTVAAGSGGGATDIRLTDGLWNSDYSVTSRIMVAGGGGGANGDGGSITGRKNGGFVNPSESISSVGTNLIGNHGSQAQSTSSALSGGSGTKGAGGSGRAGITAADVTSGQWSDDYTNAAGGGGGYFGGGASLGRIAGGGGGSSYVYTNETNYMFGTSPVTTGEPEYAFALAESGLDTSFYFSDITLTPGENGYDQTVNEFDGTNRVSKHGSAVITYLNDYTESNTGNTLDGSVSEQIEYTLIGDALTAYEGINSYSNTSSTEATKDTLNLSYPSFTMANSTRANEAYARVWKLVLQPGIYKFTLAGAQGGSVLSLGYDGVGGAGALITANLTLTEKTTMYLTIGGAGASWSRATNTSGSYIAYGGFNGGGDALTGAGGGGATDLRMFYNETAINNAANSHRNASGTNYLSAMTSLASFTNLSSRIMVAGGGGGGNYYTNSVTTTYRSVVGSSAGTGSGSIANSSINMFGSAGANHNGAGGGRGASYSSQTGSALGNGGNANMSRTSGGGGGYYGGGPATTGGASGGGGSSYVSGFAYGNTYPGNVTYNGIEYAFADTFFSGGANKLAEELMTPQSLVDSATYNTAYAADGYASIQVVKQGVTSTNEDDDAARRADPNGTAIVTVNADTTTYVGSTVEVKAANIAKAIDGSTDLKFQSEKVYVRTTQSGLYATNETGSGYTSRLAGYYADVLPSDEDTINLKIKRYPFATDKSGLGVDGSPYDNITRGDLVDGELLLYVLVGSSEIKSYVPILIKVSDGTEITAQDDASAVSTEAFSSGSGTNASAVVSSSEATSEPFKANVFTLDVTTPLPIGSNFTYTLNFDRLFHDLNDGLKIDDLYGNRMYAVLAETPNGITVNRSGTSTVEQPNYSFYKYTSDGMTASSTAYFVDTTTVFGTPQFTPRSVNNLTLYSTINFSVPSEVIADNNSARMVFMLYSGERLNAAKNVVTSSSIDYVNIFDTEKISYLVINFTAENERPIVNKELYTNEVSLNLNEAGANTVTLDIDDLFIDGDFANNATAVDGTAINSGNIGSIYNIAEIIVPEYEYVALPSYSAVPSKDYGDQSTGIINLAQKHAVENNYYNVSSTSTGITLPDNNAAWGDTSTGWANDNKTIAINTTNDDAYATIDYTSSSITITGLHATHSMYSADRGTYTSITSGTRTGTSILGVGSDVSNLGHIYVLVRITDKGSRSDAGIWLPIAIKVEDTAPRQIGENNGIDTNVIVRGGTDAQSAIYSTFTGKAGDALLIEPVFMINNMSTTEIGYYKSGANYYQWGSSNSINALPNGTKFASYPLCLDDDVYLRDGVYNDMVTVDNSTEWQQRFYESFGSEETVKQFFTVEEVKVYYEASTLPDNIKMSSVVQPDPDNNGYYYAVGLKLNLLRSTHDYTMINGKYTYTANYVYGSVGVRDALSETNAATEMKIAIRIDPSEIVKRDNANIKTKPNAITLTNDTLNYRTGAQRTFVFTPYDIVNSADTYGNPIEGTVLNDGLTLAAATGNEYAPAGTQESYFEYAADGEDFNPIEPFEDAYNQNVLDRLIDYAATKSFKAISSSNVYSRSDIFEGSELRHVFDVSATTASNSMKISVMNGFTYDGKFYQLPLLKIETLSTNAASGEPVNIIITDGLNELELTITVKVYNTAPFLSDDSVRKLTTSTETGSYNTLSIAANAVIGDRDTGDVLTYSTGNGVSVGVLDHEGKFVTNYNGITYSDYLTAELTSSTMLVLSALSSTQSLDRQVYVQFYAFDIVNRTECLLPVVVLNSSPNLNLSDAYAFTALSDEALENEKQDIEVYVKADSYESASWQLYYDAEENEGYKYIASSRAVADNLIRDGAIEPRVKVLSTDNDSKQGVILNAFNYNNGITQYKYDVVPTVGLNNSLAQNNFGVIAVMQNLEEAAISQYLDIVYFIDYNGATYAVSSIELNNYYQDTVTHVIVDINGKQFGSGDYSGITSEDIYNACFSQINGQSVFSITNWAIRILHSDQLVNTLNILISYRDDFANGGDSAEQVASYSGDVKFGEEGYQTAVSGKNFAHIAYLQKVSGFRTITSYTSTDNFYSFKSAEDRYVPYSTSTGTYAVTKYSDGLVDNQNYYKYPSSISIGASGSGSDTVYIPMSYFAMYTGTTNQNYDEVGTDSHAALFDGINTVNTTFNIANEYLNALTLTVTETGKMPLTYTGSEINERQDFITIGFADGYVANQTMRENLLKSDYANPYLGVYYDAGSNTYKKASNYNIAQVFGISIQRKNTRTANVRLSLSVQIAKYAISSGYGHTASNAYKNWTNAFTLDDTENEKMSVSIPITVDNSALSLKGDTTTFDIAMNTATSEYLVALNPNGEEGVLSDNSYSIVYSDADTNDSAMFYLDSVYGGLDSASWVDSVNRSGSSLSQYEIGLKTYFGGIANLGDGISPEYQPNDGVYGSNNVKYSNSRVPIQRQSVGAGVDGYASGNEGFSSYFALGLRSSIVNGRTVYSLIIMPRTKTVMSEAAILEVASKIGGISNSASIHNLTEEELKTIYATRGLNVRFATANGSPYERLTSVYYPLKILVTDYASTTIGQNYVVPITLNIEISNSQPTSSYSTNSYALTVSTGESASVNLAEVLRDDDLLQNTSGEFYTEEQFNNDESIVGINYETGDYLVSPYKYIYPGDSASGDTVGDLRQSQDSSLAEGQDGKLTVSDNKGAVVMYMNSTGQLSDSTRANAIVQSENRVVFKVNYRLSNAEGGFVNAVSYEYKVYDNWAKDADDCATVRFTINIANQRPTAVVQEDTVTMRTGDVFVVSAVDPSAFNPTNASSSYNAFIKSYENQVLSARYGVAGSEPAYSSHLGYDSRGKDSSVNFVYGGNNYTAWDVFGSDAAEFNGLTSNEAVSANGGIHLGYTALATDDTPWTLRISNASYNSAYLDSRIQNVLASSESAYNAGEAKPISYVFRAKSAVENQTIVFTVTDADGMSINYTIRYSIVSSAPEARTDIPANVSEVVYDNGSSASDANYNVYLSADGGTFTGSNSSVGTDVTINGTKKAYSTIYLNLDDIANDPDGSNSSLSLYGGVFGSTLPGYFGINRTGKPDNDYIDVTFNESARRLEISLKKYNPLRVSEIVEFYIRDPGSNSFDNALHVCLNVYTVYSNVVSTQYANSPYTTEEEFIAAPTEQISVVSTSEYNENNTLYSTVVFNKDLKTNDARNYGGYISDSDFADYPDNYTVNVYALINSNDLSRMSRAVFMENYVFTYENDLSMDDINSGVFRAHSTGSLGRYLVSSRNSNGTFNNSLVSNSTLRTLSSYIAIEHLSSGLRLRPASSTFDDDIPLYISVTKTVGSGAENTNAVLVGGFLLNVKVENAAPTVSTSTDINTVDGYAGDSFSIDVFNTDGTGALFADNDIGDEVTCNFTAVSDDDYAARVVGYIYNNELYDGSTTSKAFNDDWKTVAAKENTRAFDVSADGDTINITINRKIDFFLEAATLKYYAEYVTVVFRLTGVDRGGAEKDGLIYITIRNSDPKVNVGTFNGNGNYYTVAETGEEYYRIDAFISSENGALDLNFNEFVSDTDLLLCENNESFRLSSDVPATSGDQNLGARGNYLLPTHNSLDNSYEVHVVNNNNDSVVASAYVYKNSTEGLYSDFTQNGIMLSAVSYDKTLNGQGFFYFRLLDRDQPGYTGSNRRATGGITFAVYINILNSAPFVLEDAELSFVFEGNEADVPAATTFNVTNFVGDRNTSDISSLRVSNAIMGISMGMHYTEGHSGITTNNLFYVMMDQTNISQFTLNYYSHTYGRQTVTIVVTDGQYTTSFTLSIELIFASEELPVVENIQIYNYKTRNITISDLINSVKTENEDYDVASEYTVEDITSTSNNYITIAPVKDAATPTWAITALRETGTQSAAITVDFIVNKIMENGTNKRFTKEFSVIVNRNNAPVVILRTYTFSKTDIENPAFALSAKNVVVLSTTDLLMDEEGDSMTFIKASSSVSSLIKTEILETNQLQLTFAARGTATIEYVVRDETTTETTYRFVAENEDLPSPGLFVAIAISFETNSTSWIIAFVCVGIVLIAVIVMIMLLLRRKRRREEVEALLVSEIEFEDKMLQIAQDTKRRALQIGSAAPPPVPMLEAPEDEPEIDTSLLLNAGVEMPKNLDELNEDPEALREARRRDRAKAAAAKSQQRADAKTTKTDKTPKKTNKKPPKK